MSIPVAIAKGNGIGPEIMEAVLFLFSKVEAPLDFCFVEIGEDVYKQGVPTGISSNTWEILRSTKAFLKAPITTPQGKGYKSINVTLRSSLGLFANVRPCISYFPAIDTKHPKMDVVIIRENEEDLYTGIEYRPTVDCVEALKLLSSSGTERILRFAFAYAKQMGRKKVSCFTKDNIMKISDGMFHRLFTQIAQEYPEISSDHWIIDIGSAKLAQTPEFFDVIVTLNLYGDIISDIAAQISGSVGLVGTANIGLEGTMFEAIHGSAPDIAGKNIANPSGLLLAAVQMLSYLGLGSQAETLANAWLYTIEQGFHTADIFQQGKSKHQVGTQEFSQKIADHLGKKPTKLSCYSPPRSSLAPVHLSAVSSTQRKLVGCDVFLYVAKNFQLFLNHLSSFTDTTFTLSFATNRGLQVWPDARRKTHLTDYFRLRFLAEDQAITFKEVLQLLQKLQSQNLSIVKVENLYHYDGKAGFSSTSS